MSTTNVVSKKAKLERGQKNDRFAIKCFDHLEFYTLDAKSAVKALKVGLGFSIVGKSLHETQNHIYASYVLASSSRKIKWIVTAPYLSNFQHPDQERPHPGYNPEKARDWVALHGNGVAVVGIEVEDAAEAYKKSTGVGEEGDGWATGVLEPVELKDPNGGSVVISEIIMYGDTVLRFIQKKDGYKGVFLPGYAPVEDPAPLDYGIQRMDHVVGNVPDMEKTINTLKKWLGLHTFAAFSKEDIQTEWTALNSEVLANNTDTVLFPVNEPVKHKRESQISEYLKAYNGIGVQHIALFSNDVISTVEKMREVSLLGGFEFIPTPSEYYNDPKIRKLMETHLTPAAAKTAIEFGLLFDEDEEGVLMQIFTRPLFDRPTLFVEIIQRICHGEVVDRAGCGGFGKGNFRALFQSIERMQEARGNLLKE
eukprot:TRINITY_DN584_c0_g1_i1.p1 TRINITY_DN584_c0_g1~~TRINITY_DN584_c0_g1_i1.p1  ORF type:complete len:431 (-),score=133.31 TRINITY_DN584_c0_g1_i1:50-1318(-)